MIFNIVLAESAIEYDVIQESKKIKTIEDANEELKQIKAGNHKNPLKWIKYVLNIVLPTGVTFNAAANIGTINPVAGAFIGVLGGLTVALSGYLNGAPDSITDKYKELVALRPKVDKAIRSIENNKKIDDKEKQKSITQLRKFRDKLDGEINKYENRIREKGAFSAAIKGK